MQPTVEEQSQVADGHSLRIGPLIWPRPYFPSCWERAALVKDYLPRWAIATGQTAGFVFTGMGSPEPWTLLRHAVPAISPLERTAWASSLVNPTHHHLVRMSGLWLTCRQDTVMETLLRKGGVESAATQIMMLSDTSADDLRTLAGMRRAGPSTREFAAAVLVELTQLRADYPDITRYTS